MLNTGKKRRKKKLESYQNFREYFMEDLRKHPEDIDEYLELAIEDFEKERNTEAFLSALRIIAEAKESMTELAKKTHLSRQALYKAFSTKGNPRLDTIFAILNALGYSISIKPLSLENN
jgi:probable addiction module antidote protein